MPTGFLTDAQRARLAGWPSELGEADLAAYFTLSPEELDLACQRRGDANRLGFALQLVALRLLGFVPDLAVAPPGGVRLLAAQLGVDAGSLPAYAARAQTRSDHLAEVMAALGFSPTGRGELKALGDWLTERALEHDQPALLLGLACERLRGERLLRPGLSVVERLVAQARERAEEETYRRLGDLVRSPQAGVLDRLLVPDPSVGRTPLAWLRTPATSATPGAIVGEFAKLAFLAEMGAPDWDLSQLNPNRLKLLAGVARRATNQALQRAHPQRRYPTLVAFCAEAAATLTDEVIDLFDRALADTDARARRAHEERQRAAARAARENVALFAEVARILLDPGVSDAQVRTAIYARVPAGRLEAALAAAETLARPLDDAYVDLLDARYAYVREFAPAVVGALDLQAGPGGAAILEGVELLRRLNVEGRCRLPDDAPMGFVPTRWRAHLRSAQGAARRHY